LSVLDAALAYVGVGWWLVPTSPSDIKNPGSVLGKTWQRRSSSDPEQIQRWFGGDQGYGIALHCGPSGICAFDLDHPAAIPAELVRGIAAHNPPHQSTRTDTRGRGHYLFAVSPDAPPGSSAGGLGPNWGDVRSGNTVIILAPTPHPKPTGQYVWVSHGQIPPLPAELAARLAEAPAARGDLTSATTLAAELADDAVPAPALQTILDQYLELISGGQCRHDTMRAAQLALVDAAASGGAGLSAALVQLRDAFEAQIGPDPSREGEFDRTLWGAFQIKAGEIESSSFEIPREVAETGGSGTGLAPEEQARPTIMVDGNLLGVINNLLAAMKSRWDGWALFNYGTAIAALEDSSVRPLERNDFPLWIARTARTMVRKGSDKVDAWPDGNVIGSIRASYNEWQPLERVARVPFLREDGSICGHAGYDPASRAVLVLDPTVTWPQVPVNPSPTDVQNAVWTLLTDWLGDMPFESDADRANALGTVLTPFIRGNVPLSPLAVVDGTQMGVGKNLLADCISLVVRGTTALPMPYTSDDQETRKAITSAFRTSVDLFVFDEAHTVTGAALARALTSITYTDRLLGESRMLEFPNRVTWMALGNNVTVLGDVARRVYRIRLAPAGASPENRPNSQFAHPDLRGWTLNNRARLVHACLTLVRAWYAADCPEAPTPPSMGSFESWERVVGGVLHLAGVSGFLTNTQEWRSESDYQSQYWATHLTWLATVFPEGTTFSSAQATAELNKRAGLEFSGGDEVTPPPPLLDPEEKGYSFKLGQAYAKILGRDFDGYRIIRPPNPTGSGVPRTGKVARWTVTAR
jgi:hypothetical protein